MRFCGHLKDGTQLLLTDDEIINNALKQEKQGIKPHYCFMIIKRKKQQRRRGGLFGLYMMAVAAWFIAAMMGK